MVMFNSYVKLPEGNRDDLCVIQIYLELIPDIAGLSLACSWWRLVVWLGGYPNARTGCTAVCREETENHVSHPEENPRTGSSIDPGLLPKCHSEGTASMFIPRIFPHHKFIACVSFSCWLCNYEDEANPREHRRFVLLIDVKSPGAFAYSKQLHTP